MAFRLKIYYKAINVLITLQFYSYFHEGKAPPQNASVHNKIIH